MNKSLFIDLEGTVIGSWNDPRLINEDSVRKFIRWQDVDHVNIFSFAIWTQKDLEQFHRVLQPQLESALDTRIINVPMVADMMAVDTDQTSMVFDNACDFITTRTKKDAFIAWVNTNWPQHDCILVDDVVPDITITDRLTDRKIHLVNINNIGLFHD